LTSRASADSPSLLESIARTLFGVRSPIDALSTSEDCERAFAGSRTGTESPTTSESAFRLLVRPFSASESVLLSESADAQNVHSVREFVSVYDRLEFEYSIVDHWSLGFSISDRFDYDSVVDAVNF